jgi:hypothetical protein
MEQWLMLGPRVPVLLPSRLAHSFVRYSMLSMGLRTGKMHRVDSICF